MSFGVDLFGGATREPAACAVRVGSARAEITDLYPFLVELTVETNRTEAATATLTFETRRDEKGQWLVQDAGDFKLWDAILIEAVFGTRTEEVMRGYIRAINTEYPENQGSAVVKVECQDDSFRLDREQHRKAWGTTDQPTSDTQILSEILDPYGLGTSEENGDGMDQLVGINQDETDVQFLKKRAEASGYELSFVAGQVYFGPPRLSDDPQPTMMVYAGPDTNCLSFNAHANGHQPDGVAVDVPPAEGSEATPGEPVYPDLPVMGQTRADSRASGLEPFIWRLSGGASSDPDLLNAEAQRKANDYDLHRIEAQGELDGTLYGHVLQVGLPVGVDGVGDWAGGTYYVDKVSHRFSADGYKQSFTLLRNAYGDNLSDSGGGALGGVLGKVLG